MGLRHSGGPVNRRSSKKVSFRGGTLTFAQTARDEARHIPEMRLIRRRFRCHSTGPQNSVHNLKNPNLCYRRLSSLFQLSNASCTSSPPLAPLRHHHATTQCHAMRLVFRRRLERHHRCQQCPRAAAASSGLSLRTATSAAITSEVQEAKQTQQGVLEPLLFASLCVRRCGAVCGRGSLSLPLL